MRDVFERHDRYNFEAKISYPLDTRQKKNKFFLAFYFFIPSQLNITRKNYSQEDFYADMHTYIRFRNPRFSLPELLDTANTRNPLNQIAAGITALREAPDAKDASRKIIYEIRMFGTIFRTLMREEVRDFIRLIRQEQAGGAENFDTKLREFLDGLQKLERRLEELSRNLAALDTDRELQEARAFARDLVSLDLQNRLTQLLEVCRRYRKNTPKKITDTLVRMIEEHMAARELRGSRLVHNKESLNENFTYWEGILKKYFQGVLYLRVRDKNTAGKARHLFYGIAAGIAMLLSVILSYWISLRFSSQESVSFIVAVVVAYIIRDRIKDIIRGYSNTLLRLFFPDRKFVIDDPLSGKNIGTVRESAHFLPAVDIPQEVAQTRRQDHMTRVEEQGKPEEVFVYHKVVALHTKKISRSHTRHRDIDDIMRFNIRKLMQYADDAFHYDRIWDPRAKRVRRVKCAKVYHLNLVIRMETLAGQAQKKTRGASAKEKKRIIFQRVRVILNQDGIVRMSEA